MADCAQLSVWMEGLQKQLSAPLCVSPDTVEALQTLISQQQQQQANTQVGAARSSPTPTTSLTWA